MKITHIVPYKLRLFISLIVRKSKLKKRLKVLQQSRKVNSEKRFFVLNIPSHGNMGDQLIAFAIDKYLSIYFPETDTEFFTTGELECGVNLLQKVIRKNDVIFITGGGFLGDIYPEEELRFHNIMKYFKNNKIILFPQTFTYYEGSNLLNNAIQLHRECKNIVISVREKRSYNFIKYYFNRAEVLLLPDITTFLNYSNISHDREGIILCSRKDKEKNESNIFLFKGAVDWCNENNVLLRHIDTQVPYPVNSEMRNQEIKSLMEKFASAKLVITDRLHGMLFSIISGTPVIAIDNSTHKVADAVEDWFWNIPYVKFSSDLTSLINNIKLLYSAGNQAYVNDLFVDELEKLLKYAES